MAATGTRYYTPNPFEFDANGVPLAGALLYFYTTGTASPLDTYSDVTLSTPNTNPVVADGNGRFGTIFLTPATAYKVVLQNADAVQIWTEDPVGPAAGGAPANTVGMVGEVRMFAGPSANVPSGWYLCYGQAISRSTFASLFTVIGITWGAGDSSTTFNLPDLRGRSLFGVDNMGGTPANRVTSGVSGITGTTLGAGGGDQATQSHTHALSDPTHNHTLTDPGHAHEQQIGQGSGATNAWSITGTGALVNMDIMTATATTGITLAAAATGITISAYGTGASQNMPPAAMINAIIYAGA